MLLISPVHATERFNYGQVWKLWPDYVRDVYLMGFQDGSVYAYFKALHKWLPPGEAFKKPEPQRVKEVRESVFLFVDRSALRDVMTSLYEDPANTYIRWEKIVYLARDKLMGKDISQSLIKARKDAHEEYELLRKWDLK